MHVALFCLVVFDCRYAESKAGTIRGFGSPHMKERIRNNIWPMAQLMQGLTSSSLDEKVEMIDMLTVRRASNCSHEFTNTSMLLGFSFILTEWIHLVSHHRQQTAGLAGCTSHTIQTTRKSILASECSDGCFRIFLFSFAIGSGLTMNGGEWVL